MRVVPGLPALLVDLPLDLLAPAVDFVAADLPEVDLAAFLVVDVSAVDVELDCSATAAALMASAATAAMAMRSGNPVLIQPCCAGSLSGPCPDGTVFIL